MFKTRILLIIIITSLGVVSLGQDKSKAYSFEQVTSQTKSLVLSNKKITKIPDNLYNYTNLETLDLSGNEIEKLSPKIGELSNLKHLNISYNKIKELPKEIGQLTNLQSINIFDNPIVKLPNEISELKNLKILKAGALNKEHQLTSLPENIGKLQQLTELDLRFNNFTILPIQLGTLNKLTQLDLWVNKQLDIKSLCVALTNYPKKVILSANVEDYFEAHPETLVVFIPDLVLPKEALEINNLVEIQTAFGYYGKILKPEIDFLKGKKPSTEKEKEAYNELLKTKVINWTGLGITKLPDEIVNFQNLETLILSNNQLLELPERKIRELKKLKKFEISGNPIIFLSEKTIAFIKDKKLMPADSVVKYDVDVSLAFAKKGLCKIPDALWEYDYLVELYLNDNKLKELPKEIANIKELSTLNLNNNQIKQLPSEINNLELLTELFIENNGLTELPDFSKLQSLYTLNLNNNNLTTVISSLKKLKHLEKLNLKGNKIPEKEIKKLKKMMPDCEIVY